MLGVPAVWQLQVRGILRLQDSFRVTNVAQACTICNVNTVTSAIACLVVWKHEDPSLK